MDLILVRHALPERLAVAPGAVADPGLCAEGRAQSEALGAWLSRESVAGLYTSPMRRAAETAEILGARLALGVTTIGELVERDHQSSEYVPLEEIKQSDPERWRALVAEGGLYAGVDLVAFRLAIVAALEDIIAAHRGETVVASLHGSGINAWTSHVLGREDILVFEPAYTGINRFRAASTGERSIVSLNETGHLRNPAS